MRRRWAPHTLSRHDVDCDEIVAKVVIFNRFFLVWFQQRFLAGCAWSVGGGDCGACNADKCLMMSFSKWFWVGQGGGELVAWSCECGGRNGLPLFTGDMAVG